METEYSHNGDKLVRPLFSGLEDFTAAVHAFPDTDLDAFSNFALDSILELVDADSGSLFLWDEFAKALVPRAIRSPRPERIRASRIKLREGISGLVADQGHCVLVKNIHGDSRFFSVSKNGSYNSASFICLPLIVHNKLVGIINITERDNRAPFTEENFEHARAAAAHVALACEKIRTIDRLRGQVEDLTKIVEDRKSGNGHAQGNGTVLKIRKLASYWAHELNDPLDAIRRYVNLAVDQLPDDSLAKEYILKAKAGIRRAIYSARGLQTISDAYCSGNMRTMDLRTILDEILSVAMQDPEYQRIAFVRDFCAEPITVLDAGLQTVFMNLINNARHAMAGAGEILISTRREGQSAVVSVRDSGPGIPEHLRSQIFEPFFSTKKQNEGKGIGLCIARDIVTRSGGVIELDNAGTKGAAFKVTLPCQKKEHPIS